MCVHVSVAVLVCLQDDHLRQLDTVKAAFFQELFAKMQVCCEEEGGSEGGGGVVREREW